ncbi:hypothetical protein [Jatrophihabitans endophyticus]|uniref:hypothetical protein n=1 Tax=Jatrophihabitans endophyticus TaxID=1206085 RepID=UPI0019DB0665|nr:hypothetical protein [Jatrophihabitans endophyticus]MBE7187640.1 hypothetical protein [Jatrophihabitans endophyticus]
MTTLLTRAPSPVPLSERSVPRDVSDNVWVQAPDLDEVLDLFDGVDWKAAAEVPVRRRPTPGRASA